MTTLKDINTAIITGSFTNEELTSISDAVRFARSRLVSAATRTLRAGAKVKFTSSRTGRDVTGIVTKVNRKFIIVQEGMMNWRVPGNMLTAV